MIEPDWDELTEDMARVLLDSPFITSGKYLRFDEMHRLEALHMDNEPHKFVIHDHWRGVGAHEDFRRERTKDGFILDGDTIAGMKPGITKEPVTTIERARELANNESLWKISNDPGPLRMFAETKKPEPKEWLYYQGLVKPGGVGATRREYGLFFIRDKGIYYYGAQKPYFREYFLEGHRYTGRWIFRLIERRKPTDVRSKFLWLCGKPIEQTPYVMTPRAVKDGWIPPWRVSCLPPKVRDAIPAQLRFWQFQDLKKRLEVREALVEAIKKKDVVLEYEGTKLEFSERQPYVLQHYMFKKRTLVRAGPSEEFYKLRIKQGEKCLTWTLDSSPLEGSSPGKLESEPASTMKIQGYVAPSTAENPTPDTPLYVVTESKGSVIVVQSSDAFYKLSFLSGLLKGLWVASKELGGTLWTVQRSSLPEVK